MIFDNIKAVAQLCLKGDFDAADALIHPVERTLNKATTFRSALMVSTHNLKHILKVPQLEAEAIMLNLEDGVSNEQKPTALRLCAALLGALPQSTKKLVVRVNALDEGGREEIGYLNRFRPDAIRIPKIRTLKEVETALELIDEPIELHLSIETKEAWLAMHELKHSHRVSTYYLGILDLFADLKLPHRLIDIDNPTLRYMLSHFLVTCKALHVKPVSFVFQDYHDRDSFKKWLSLENEMGFDAKGCLSPMQVKDVHDFFGINEHDIQKAKTIVTLFEAKQREGISGFSHETYGFIDEPIYKGALSILEQIGV